MTYKAAAGSGRYRPRPPHPQRCETCLHYSMHTKTHVKFCNGIVIPGCGEDTCVLDWIGSKGCASHSSPAAVLVPDVKITYEDGAAITGHELRLLNWVIENLKDERCLAPLIEIQTGIRKREEMYENLCEQHDEQIRQEAAAKERERRFTALDTFVRTDHSLNHQIGKRILLAKIESLRGDQP